MNYRGVIALIIMLVILPVVLADSYEMHITENNTAAVTAIIEGSGLHKLELPKDAVPEVKGALYLKEGNSLTLSIGSTGKAVVEYETKECITKINDSFKLSFAPEKMPVSVTLPDSAELISAAPDSFINETAKKIEFGSVDKIEVTYSFESSAVQENVQNNSGVIFISAAIAMVFMFILIVSSI